MTIEEKSIIIAGFDDMMKWHVPRNTTYKPYWGRYIDYNRDVFVEIPPKHMKYHKSFDWLHEVIRRVELLMPDIKIPRDMEALKAHDHGSEKYMDVIALPISTGITEVFDAVFAFVVWFNEQKNEQGKIQEGK